MTDAFLFLTPVLLLGIVALLGFIGCLSKPSPPVGVISISPSSGPTAGGTAVTIAGPGEDFGNNIKVKFGTPPNEADVPGTASSQTVMTATTPSHSAGSVDIEVDYDLPMSGDATKSFLPSGSFFTFYDNVVPLLPPALSRKSGGTLNSVSLNAFPGTKLVIATVQWGGIGGVLSSLSAPGVTFTQLGTTDVLNPQQVASFYAVADLSSGLTLTATISVASNTDFNLLVSAYDNVDPASAPASPTSKQGTGVSPAPSLTFQTSALAPGDLIYAIAIARNSATVLSGSWLPGSGFTAEAGQNGYLLLENYLLQQSDVDAGQLNVTATDANGTATSRWYLFAAAIKHM